MIDRKLMTCKMLTDIRSSLQKDVRKIFKLKELLEGIPDSQFDTTLRIVKITPVYRSKLKMALATDDPSSYYIYFSSCDTRPYLDGYTLGYISRSSILDILNPMVSDVSHPDVVIWEYAYRQMNNLIKLIRSQI